MPHQAPQRSLFSIPAMDCPSEELLICLALPDLGDAVVSLQFDIETRAHVIVHSCNVDAVADKLVPLDLVQS